MGGKREFSLRNLVAEAIFTKSDVGTVLQYDEIARDVREIKPATDKQIRNILSCYKGMKVITPIYGKGKKRKAVAFRVNMKELPTKQRTSPKSSTKETITTAKIKEVMTLDEIREAFPQIKDIKFVFDDMTVNDHIDVRDSFILAAIADKKRITALEKEVEESKASLIQLLDDQKKELASYENKIQKKNSDIRKLRQDVKDLKRTVNLSQGGRFTMGDVYNTKGKQS